MYVCLIQKPNSIHYLSSCQQQRSLFKIAGRHLLTNSRKMKSFEKFEKVLFKFLQKHKIKHNSLLMVFYVKNYSILFSIFILSFCIRSFNIIINFICCCCCFTIKISGSFILSFALICLIILHVLYYQTRNYIRIHDKLNQLYEREKKKRRRRTSLLHYVHEILIL